VETLLKTILATFFKYFSKVSPKLTAKIAWSFFCKPRIRKKPLSEFESKLLQQAKQYSIKSNEYKIVVYEWKSPHSTGDAATTILLSHGWGGHALNFAFIIKQLLEDGFDVVAYDSPAHGKSSGSQTNLFQNTKAVLEVTKSIGTVYALIGHSFGTLANAYALDICKKENCLTEVEKIILIAGPNKVTDIFESFTQAMQLPNTVLNMFHQKVETIANRNIASMSAVEFLKTYTGQSLIIHDQGDRIVPFSEAETVSEGVDADLYNTSGYGHFRILAAKNVSEKIVNFLQPASD